MILESCYCKGKQHKNQHDHKYYYLCVSVLCCSALEGCDLDNHVVSPCGTRSNTQAPARGKRGKKNRVFQFAKDTSTLNGPRLKAEDDIRHQLCWIHLGSV